MPTISLCMIAKNEEKYLEQCLNSVKDFMDEIIIVDTGSTDKTKDIAKKFNAKVFEFKWVDDFSAARNESLKHATKEWILVLDADEQISKEDLPKFIELTGNKDCAAYYFIIRTYTDNAKAAGWMSSKDDQYGESKCASGYFTTRLIRLFRNISPIKFEGVVHETISSSIMEKDKIKDAPFPIHHFGRLNQDKSIYKKQLYEKLGIIKIAQKEDFHSYSQLAIQSQENGDYGVAIEFFKKSIELNKNYFKSWLNIGACYLETGKLKEAEDAFRHAAGLNPNDYSAHNNLGIVYSNSNRPEMAINEFMAAIKLNSRSASSYFNLGLAYDSVKMNNKAYEAFKRAIELNPAYKEKIKIDD